MALGARWKVRSPSSDTERTDEGNRAPRRTRHPRRRGRAKRLFWYSCCLSLFPLKKERKLLLLHPQLTPAGAVSGRPVDRKVDVSEPGGAMASNAGRRGRGEMALKKKERKSAHARHQAKTKIYYILKQQTGP